METNNNRDIIIIRRRIVQCSSSLQSSSNQVLQVLIVIYSSYAKKSGFLKLLKINWTTLAIFFLVLPLTVRGQSDSIILRNTENYQKDCFWKLLKAMSSEGEKISRSLSGSACFKKKLWSKKESLLRTNLDFFSLSLLLLLHLRNSRPFLSYYL